MKNKRYGVQEYADLYNTNKMKVYRLIKNGLIKIDLNKNGEVKLPVKIPDSEKNRKIITL